MHKVTVPGLVLTDVSAATVEIKVLHQSGGVVLHNPVPFTASSIYQLGSLFAISSCSAQLVAVGRCGLGLSDGVAAETWGFHPADPGQRNGHFMVS